MFKELVVVCQFIGLICLLIVLPKLFYKCYCKCLGIDCKCYNLPLVNTWSLWSDVYHLPFVPIIWEILFIIGAALFFLAPYTQNLMLTTIGVYSMLISIVIMVFCSIVINYRVYKTCDINTALSILMAITLYIGQVGFVIWISLYKKEL